eukprot:GHRQ01014560.1.p1 GENE.GHRQ01014560.1~~GHRQ01014560.1.p1  ORF type:complete len:104 (+),score=28.70 GHRQ01014560.1:721-1032(+)
MGSTARAAGDAPAAAPLVVQHAAPADSSELFVNRGLQTWLERRQQWIKRTADTKQQHTSRKRPYSPAVTPEQVLSFTPLPKPVPLQDVIEVLTEVWEQEDFYT